MEALQKKLASLDEKLADPSLYDRDPGEAQSLGTKRDKLAAELGIAEQAWLEATEDYEAEASA